MLEKYMDIKDDVGEALRTGKPVVALESTIISHGMPYPENIESAKKSEAVIKEAGAV
jgi:pseudouridine-5'-phosphate glycosidase